MLGGYLENPFKDTSGLDISDWQAGAVARLQVERGEKTYRFFNEIHCFTAKSGRPSQGNIHIRGPGKVNVRLQMSACCLGWLPCKPNHQSWGLGRIKYRGNVFLMKCRLWFIAGLHAILDLWVAEAPHVWRWCVSVKLELPLPGAGLVLCNESPI